MLTLRYLKKSIFSRGKISGDCGGWHPRPRPKPKEEEDEGFIKKGEFLV
jgi:hypothetical protein